MLHTYTSCQYRFAILLKNLIMSSMARQRAKGKVILGGYVNGTLSQAVDVWCAKHPGVTRSDFVAHAALEKLQRDGVQISQDEALAKHYVRGNGKRRSARPDQPDAKS